MNLYIVIAYRWGWSNDHWYFVYGGTDEAKACALARAEVADRAGKYCCGVWKVSADGTNLEMHEYHGVTMDGKQERRPRNNFRLDMAQHLGHILDRYADGWLTVRDTEAPEPGRMKMLRVEPDPTLRGEVERAREAYGNMQRISDETNAKLDAQEDKQQ